MNCSEEGCPAQVMNDRGYCSRHGGPRRYRKEQQAKKKAEQQAAKSRSQTLRKLGLAKETLSKLRKKREGVGTGLSFWSDYDRKNRGSDRIKKEE